MRVTVVSCPKRTKVGSGRRHQSPHITYNPRSGTAETMIVGTPNLELAIQGPKKNSLSSFQTGSKSIRKTWHHPRRVAPYSRFRRSSPVPTTWFQVMDIQVVFTGFLNPFRSRICNVVFNLIFRIYTPPPELVDRGFLPLLSFSLPPDRLLNSSWPLHPFRTSLTERSLSFIPHHPHTYFPFLSFRTTSPSPGD